MEATSDSILNRIEEETTGVVDLDEMLSKMAELMTSVNQEVMEHFYNI